MLFTKGVMETEQGWSVICHGQRTHALMSMEQFRWLEDNIKRYRVQKWGDEIHVVFKSKDDAMLAYLRL